MTSTGTSIVSPHAAGLTSLPSRSFEKIKATIWLALSPKDKDTYQAAKSVLDGHQRKVGVFAEEFKRELEKTFAFPLYSDELKKFVAATYIGNEFVFLVGDRFLTEELILGYIERSQQWMAEESYIKAMMGSSHLSGRIIDAASRTSGTLERNLILELTPEVMLTPKMIYNWSAGLRSGGRYVASRVLFDEQRGALSMSKKPYEGPDVWSLGLVKYVEDALSLAAHRVRQAHPQYEEFPDEWVLKVFCGA